MADPTKAPESKTKRVEAVIEKPFVYGSMSFWMGPEAEETHSHQWHVYVRGLDNEDMSYFIKRVSFTLHESFKNHIRSVETPPFQVTEMGWGEFDIKIQIFFHDLRESPVSLTHHLKLFPTAGSGPRSTKKPVVSEMYDEILIVNPPERFHSQLQQTPPQRFTDHPLNPFFMTAQFAEGEQKQVAKLKAARVKIERRIQDLRKRLYICDADIAQLNAGGHYNVTQPSAMDTSL
eukprot:g60265.t1